MKDIRNAKRFTGFAHLYEDVRPTVPGEACDLLIGYLGKAPETVVDMGCGTGLSTRIWKGKCSQVTGIEPSEDMLAVARGKTEEGISFLQAFSDHTSLPDNYADIVVCSQSFHWMEPRSTLDEVHRILKPRGVFATIDCDWPPLCDWRAEQQYDILKNKVKALESSDPQLQNSFHRWEKEKHLLRIQSCGHFSYCREIVFSSKEPCDARRFVGLALSQGSLQTILKTNPQLIQKDVDAFEQKILSIFGSRSFDIRFGYRMRIGVR